MSSSNIAINSNLSGKMPVDFWTAFAVSGRVQSKAMRITVISNITFIDFSSLYRSGC